MSDFTFDMRLIASVTIEAATADQARQLLCEAMENANVNFGQYPGSKDASIDLLGEVSFADECGPMLAMIDGEDIPGQTAEPFERVARAAGWDMGEDKDGTPCFMHTVGVHEYSYAASWKELCERQGITIASAAA